MCAARASPWLGLYGCCCGVVVDEEEEFVRSCEVVVESGVVVEDGSTPFPRGLLLLLLFDASSPVLWMMEPSLRERIRVDCTPGREVRWDSKAETCCGICCD